MERRCPGNAPRRSGATGGYFMNECVEHGVLQWVPAGKTKRSPDNRAGSQ